MPAEFSYPTDLSVSMLLQVAFLGSCMEGGSVGCRETLPQVGKV